MNKNFYKRLSQIILEADDEETPANDTDAEATAAEGEAPEEPAGDEGDKPEVTDEDLDDQTNDYQMNESDFDEGSDDTADDGLGDVGDDGMGDDTGEDTSMTDDSSEQNDNESSKKFMLAAQYKEMLVIISNLEKSMNNVRSSTADPEQIHYIYIVLDRIDNLKSKINFFVINNFITKPYEDLLSSFLFLKKELELIISLIEKVLDDKEDK